RRPFLFLDVIASQVSRWHAGRDRTGGVAEPMQPADRRDGSGGRRQGWEIGFLVPVPDQEARTGLALAPFTDRHCALAVNDVPPHLLQFVGRHVGARLVIIAEDRGAEIPVLGIGLDDRAARAAVDRYPVDQDLVALGQIIFEPRETANARPPPPPGGHVAAYHVLLFLAQRYVGHRASPTVSWRRKGGRREVKTGFTG